MKQPKAVFLDIDGTILRSDHSLSPRVARAVTSLEQAGILVCLATGRSWEALEPLYSRLKLSGPTICYNGAFLAGGPEGQKLNEILLNDTAARFAVGKAREHSMEFVAYRHTVLLYETEGPFVRAYRKRVGLKGTQVNFDSISNLELTKMIIMSEHEKLEEVQAGLRGRFSSDELVSTFSDPSFLELIEGGVDKGKGLRDVCSLKGISLADTVAMGDGWNDLPMLEAAGDAWIMGGAAPELLRRFPENRRAPDSNADGAALVMEALLEGREPVFE